MRGRARFSGGSPLRGRHGFTLLELLCVAVLISVLLALGANGLEGWQRGTRTRLAAQSFQQALLEARDHARRRQCRVRVVFSLAKSHQSTVPEDEQPPLNAFAVFLFQEPSDQAQAGTWQAPSRSVESASGADTPLLEWVPLSTAALPSGLVGQWVRCPERPLWTPLGDGVTVDGELLDTWTRSGFTTFQQQHYYQPPAIWDGNATVANNGRSNRARFPEGYAQTPFPRDVPLVSMPLPASETVWDYSRNQKVAVRDLWGAQPILQYATSAATGVHGFDLPGLEFAPDGSLAGEQRTPLKVSFHPEHSAQPMYEVDIAPTDGRAILVQP